MTQPNQPQRRHHPLEVGPAHRLGIPSRRPSANEVESRRLSHAVALLRRRNAAFDAEVAAAARIVRALLRGRRVPDAAYGEVLAWIYRNRCQRDVLEVARVLARIDAREIAELGVGIVRHARTPEEVALGRALFGL